MRILIFTSSGGTAHDAAAYALKAWIQRWDPQGEVWVEHVLENASPVTRGGVELYNWIQRHAPWLHKLYWRLVEFEDLWKPGTLSFGRNYVIALLLRLKPDLLISTHPHINRGHFDLAQRLLPGLRCITCCTELDGGFGFSRNWLSRRCEAFWTLTPDVSEEVRRRGYRHLPAPALGPLLDPCFVEELEHPSPAPEACPLVVLGSGANGANNHIRLLESLRPLAGRIRVVALCAEGHHPDAPCQRPQRFEQADVIVGAIRAAAEHHQRARLRSGGRMLQFLHKTGIQERAQRRRRQMPVPPAPHLFGDIRCKGPEGFAAAAQPVTAEAKATIELRATGDAAQPRQQPLSQIKVASVDVGMGGNQQIGLQAQQQRNHVIATEAEGAWFPQVFEFHQSPIQLVQPGGMPLNPVVKLHTTAGDRAGVLQHMLNPHFTLWIPPLNPGLQGVGRRVMGGAAAGGEDQDAHRIPPFTSVALRSELEVPTTP